MMCERCGNDISDNTSICPVCGTVSFLAKAANQSSTAYGPFLQSDFGGPPPYQQDYTPPSNPSASSQPDYAFPPRQNRGYGPQFPPFSSPQAGYIPQQNYGPAYNANAGLGYQPGPINVTVINTPGLSGKNESALIAEVLLSLFGIFGVGWLMAGESTVGAILLICSFVIYWPILLLGTIFTFGFGLICLGPMAIAAIIINALLLNNTLNRKAVQFLAMPPPPMQMHRQ